MSVKIPMDFRLSPVDPTVTARVAGFAVDDDRDSVLRNLIHRTRLPSGFYNLSFDLYMNQDDYWRWREDWWMYHLLVKESGGKVIWDGRFENIGKSQTGWPSRLTFRGYWRNFTDGIDNVAHNALGASIVQNLRDNLHANTDQLSTSNAEITAVTDTLNIDRTGKGTSAWQTIVDPLAGLLTVDDTSGNPVDLAVWDDRIVHFKARNPTSVDWQTYMDAGVASFGPSNDWEDYANAVYGRHGAGTTAAATDDDSITRLIRREREIGSTDLDATTATAARDNLLAQRADGVQRSEKLVINRVYDGNNMEAPLCRVRAGEVIRITDFHPRTADVDSATPNGLNTFWILETQCDHRGAARTLTMRVDAESQSLAAMLRRGGIS